MYYNLKKEQIYYMSSENEGEVMSIFLAGKTPADSGYIVAQNTSVQNRFDRYQFEYVTSGKGYLKSGGKTMPLCKGDFFFVNKSCERTLFSDKDDPMEKLFITVGGTLIDSLVTAYNMTAPYLVLNLDVSENFDSILNTLLRADDDIQAAYEKTAIELFKIIQKINRGVKVTSQNRASDRCTQIMEYIDANIYRAITLDELAERFFISKQQILRIFKAKFNTTPARYISDKRIALASYYLSKSEISVYRIAEMLGFSDSKHFSKLFKAHTGYSPRDFRAHELAINKKRVSELIDSINK